MKARDRGPQALEARRRMPTGGTIDQGEHAFRRRPARAASQAQCASGVVPPSHSPWADRDFVQKERPRHWPARSRPAPRRWSGRSRRRPFAGLVRLALPLRNAGNGDRLRIDHVELVVHQHRTDRSLVEVDRDQVQRRRLPRARRSPRRSRPRALPAGQRRCRASPTVAWPGTARFVAMENAAV